MDKKNLPSSSNSTNPSGGGGGFMSGLVSSIMGSSKNKKTAQTPAPMTAPLQ